MSVFNGDNLTGGFNGMRIDDRVEANTVTLAATNYEYEHC